MSSDLMLIINPGSTSTRLAIFERTQLVQSVAIAHDKEELRQFPHVIEQYSFRLHHIEQFLTVNGAPSLGAVVSRGGLLRPMPSGTYLVNEAMVADLKRGVQGEHASNLGGLLARGIADPRSIPAYVVDPVAVDEFLPEARLSGLPQIPRRSLGHALNIRAVARRVAVHMGTALDAANFVVAHLGGGISIAPLQQGRILDYNDAREAGPFSPERAGTLPAKEVVDLAFSGNYTLAQLLRLLTAEAGLVGYLQTNDARHAVALAEAGDERAQLVLDAMIYQIAKEIGAMATVLAGKVDAIILTGALANAAYLTDRIEPYVNFIAPVMVVPGEDEMLALAEGAWLVHSGQEAARVYG